MITYKLDDVVPSKGTYMHCEWPTCQKGFFTFFPNRSKFCCDHHRELADSADKKTERRDISAILLEYKKNYRILKRLYPRCIVEKKLPAQILYDEKFNFKAPTVLSREEVFFYGPYGVLFYNDETFTIVKKLPHEIEQYLKHGWDNFPE